MLSVSAADSGPMLDGCKSDVILRHITRYNRSLWRETSRLICYLSTQHSLAFHFAFTCIHLHFTSTFTCIHLHSLAFLLTWTSSRVCNCQITNELKRHKKKILVWHSWLHWTAMSNHSTSTITPATPTLKVLHADFFACRLCSSPLNRSTRHRSEYFIVWFFSYIRAGNWTPDLCVICKLTACAIETLKWCSSRTLRDPGPVDEVHKQCIVMML